VKSSLEKTDGNRTGANREVECRRKRDSRDIVFSVSVAKNSRDGSSIRSSSFSKPFSPVLSRTIWIEARFCVVNSEHLIMQILNSFKLLGAFALLPDSHFLSRNVADKAFPFHSVDPPLV
jgi:hypothetical protein